MAAHTWLTDSFSKEMADADCEILAEYVVMDAMELLPVECFLLAFDAPSSYLASPIYSGPSVRVVEPLFDPFCMYGNYVSLNISYIKKLGKIVKMKKLAIKNNKIFLCTMKLTSVNNRMSISRQFIDDYVSNHLYGQEARKVFIQHPRYNVEVFLKRTKDGRVIIHRDSPKVVRTFNITEGSVYAFHFNSFLEETCLSIYRLS
ncbi:casein kinase i isoform delta-like protein [Hordeum vulgare]|nr:casein kinase i isoform delta-like protein [Hordeum vulgare]